MQRSEVHQLSPDDIEKLIHEAVDDAFARFEGLAEKLIRELRLTDEVLSLPQAAEHFDGKVTPSTIKEYYIKGKRLPQGIDLPLPAHKIGNLYFVSKEMLYKWLTQEIEFGDLRQWQQRKFEDKKEPIDDTAPTQDVYFF